jgi:hypothetical protein
VNDLEVQSLRVGTDSELVLFPFLIHRVSHKDHYEEKERKAHSPLRPIIVKCV